MPYHPIQTTQILYNLKNHSLSSYVDLVRARKWKFPDYSDKCPICGEANCAVYFCFYERKGTDSQGVIYSVLVIRYRCRRKGNPPPSSDATFSLLPDCLVPYRLFHIETMQLVLYWWLILGLSVKQVLDKAEEFSNGKWYPAESFIYRLKILFIESAAKFNVSKYFKDRYRRNGKPIDIKIFLKICKTHTYRIERSEIIISGPIGLGLEYYSQEGGIKSSRFLFGTASQIRFRVKG